MRSIFSPYIFLAAMMLTACAAPTYRVATSVPRESVENPVRVNDERPVESRQRRGLRDAEGRELPAQILGDTDISPGKLDLLAHYLGVERHADEPDELRVKRLDVTLWYPTATGGGFSIGAAGSHGFASVGGYTPQPILGDAVTVSLRAEYGGRLFDVELREPLAQGVTRYTREPNRPEEIRPAFLRAAQQLLAQYRGMPARGDEPQG
jgi:hypothetical protein